MSPSGSMLSQESAKPDSGMSQPGAGCPRWKILDPWGQSSVCPACGYYPRLGTSVGPASQAQKSVRRAPDSPLEFWNELPRWGKILCYGVIAILVMSILARLGTAPKSFARSAWGVLQLAAARSEERRVGE